MNETLSGTRFTYWLTKQTKRDDAIGDIAKELTDDARSGCLKTGMGIKAHMMNHGADIAAFHALEQANTEWLMEIDRYQWQGARKNEPVLD